MRIPYYTVVLKKPYMEININYKFDKEWKKYKVLSAHNCYHVYINETEKILIVCDDDDDFIIKYNYRKLFMCKFDNNAIFVINLYDNIYVYIYNNITVFMSKSELVNLCNINDNYYENTTDDDDNFVSEDYDMELYDENVEYVERLYDNEYRLIYPYAIDSNNNVYLLNFWILLGSELVEKINSVDSNPHCHNYYEYYTSRSFVGKLDDKYEISDDRIHIITMKHNVITGTDTKKIPLHNPDKFWEKTIEKFKNNSCSYKLGYLNKYFGIIELTKESLNEFNKKYIAAFNINVIEKIKINYYSYHNNYSRPSPLLMYLMLTSFLETHGFISVRNKSAQNKSGPRFSIIPKYIIKIIMEDYKEYYAMFKLITQCKESRKFLKNCPNDLASII